MTDVLTLFFALLSIIALLGAAAILFLMVTGRRDVIEAAVGPYALHIAATVATVCMFGSLYLSEVANFPPCRLCWVQRGFMYPLAIGLWLAVWRGWDRIARFALPWAGAGALVAMFHVAEQRGWVGGESLCSATTPCTAVWVSHFGFITIPFMALSGFLLIMALMWVQLASGRTDEITTATTRSS
jgi:disulfide bond formation protein DsbB